MTKEDNLLLIQIDGQTNWTMNEPDLNQTKIGEYMGTVKNGLPHGQGQLCYSHGGKYILVLGKMGKKMVKGYIHTLMEE